MNPPIKSPCNSVQFLPVTGDFRRYFTTLLGVCAECFFLSREVNMGVDLKK